MTKAEIITIFRELAVLLELKGENPFKAAAYKKAAQGLESLDEDLSPVVAAGRIAHIPGIGPAIAKKIEELVKTGGLRYYRDLKTSIPDGLFEMLRIPGLGTKKVRLLYEKLGIENTGQLEYACRENHLLDLPGFGKKTQEKILSSIAALKGYRGRHLHVEVVGEAEELLKNIKTVSGITVAAIAGSLRRGLEVVKNIDLVAAAEDPGALEAHFTALPRVASVTVEGRTKVSGVLGSGINADLRIVSPGAYPYALHHFTGSRDHNTAMRGRAKQFGLKMNEYGLFRGEENVSCSTEEDIFAALDLTFIPPELRENMGEIEAAAQGALPRLVDQIDIRGVLHVHTRDSDGDNDLEILVREARRRGFEYMGVTDHSRSARYAGGLSIEAVRRQHEAIDIINARYDDFVVFKGIEADILPDGTLDYDYDTLRTFDFVVAAVHSPFQMSAAEITRRIVRALAHPLTTILAHPTGRLLLAREPYAVDVEAVLEAAAVYGKVLELNAHPWRLDLDWRYLIRAKKKDIPVAVNPDIHGLDDFDHLACGVTIARKGWLEARNCLNCLTAGDLQRFFAGIRRRIL